MPEVTLEEYTKEIDYFIEEARYLEALAHVRHILKQHSRYIGAYYLLGKVMLETDLPTLAINMFRRVLAADPEHLMARIGLGLAHIHLDNINAAIWNLERAHEIHPGDADLSNELRRLYGRRGGMEPEHVPLTRAGLARLYMRGNLTGRAVEELRKLSEEESERADLQLALAEAYWRDEKIVEAADACQRILKYLPYCLKANLLLGRLWVDSGQEEGQRYLDRAEEIDIENEMAKELFGSASPLETRSVTLERLSYDPQAIDVDQQSEWFQRLEAASVSVGISEAPPEMSETDMRLVDITAGLESQIDIPDWLRELGSLGEEEEGGDLSWMADLGMSEEEAGLPSWMQEEQVETPEEEQIPEWFSEVEESETGEMFMENEDLLTLPEEDIEEAEVPDWFAELDTEAVGAEEEEEGMPDWLQELAPEAPEITEVPETEAMPEFEGVPEEAEEVPDWLSQLEPAAAEETIEEEEIPDWLQALKPQEPQAPEEAETIGSEEIPDWLQELKPQAPEAPAAEAPAPAEEEEEIPDWLSELKPAAEAEEVEELEAEVPDWLREFQEEEAVSPEAEGEDVPEWLRQFREEEELEEVSGAAEAPEEAPDWLRQFQPEETAPPAAELEEEVEEEELELSEEGFFGWAAFGEEAAEVKPEAAPPTAPEATRPAAPEAPAAEAAPPPAAVEQPPAEEIEKVAEVLEAAPEEAAPPPAAEEEMLSGDDALAWLKDLAAGKEDELRAQAEVESQARVDEILGRKRAPAEAAPPPVEEAPPPEEAPTPPAEEPVAEVTAPVEEAPPETAPPPTAEEEMLSGDDALAWLEGFAAGKEDELRAQAEVESQARVDEILGRKRAPAEAAPPPVEEAPPETAPPPTAEEEMLSGDDALAWLKDLAAGKEDELRAQAEVESQARVDEILGRKRAPAEAAPPPVEEAPPPEEAPTPPAEEPVAEVTALVEEAPPEPEAAPEIEEEMLSGDDALAWLESFAAGKEDELRAQAEVESQARVDEILGRKRAPAEAAPPPVEEALPPEEAPTPPAEEPVAEVTAPVEEAPPEPEEVVAEVLPVEPIEVEETPPAEEILAQEEMLSGDDALAWLKDLAAGKEDELRAQAEAESRARVDEILGRKREPAAPPEEEKLPAPESPPTEIVPEEVVEELPAEKPPAEEAPVAPSAAKAPVEEEPRAEAFFGWSAFGKEAVEIAAPAAEAPVAEEVPVAEAAAPAEVSEEEGEYFGWSSFGVEIKDTPVEQPEEEEGLPVFGFTRFGTGPLSTGQPAKPAPEPEPEPEPEVEPPAPKPAPPKKPEAPQPSQVEIDALRAQIKKKRSDHAARLTLARALWLTEQVKESMDHYARLIRAGAKMDEVIRDLKRYSESASHTQVLRTLGDAYMKEGLLDQALETYNQAMDLL